MSSTVVRIGGYAVSAALDEPILDGTTELARREAVFIFVQTDDGVIGWGEAVTYGLKPQSMLDFVLDELAESVLGTRPEDVVHTTHRLALQSQQHDRGGIATIARGSLDCALWDAAARQLDVPLRNLLGSDVETIDAYASLGFYRRDSAEEGLHAEVAASRSAGYRSFKIKIGRRQLAEDMRRVALVREMVGEDALLAVDANRAYADRQVALAAARALSEFDVAWLEEPFPLDDEESYRWLCRQSPIRIAAGENAFTIERLRRLIDQGVTVIQPDVSWTGGFTRIISAAKLAEERSCTFAPHSFSSSLNAVTAAQVVAATTSHALVEIDCTSNPLMNLLTETDWSLAVNEHGQFVLPEEFGCGWTPSIPRDLVVREASIGLGGPSPGLVDREITQKGITA